MSTNKPTSIEDGLKVSSGASNPHRTAGIIIRLLFAVVILGGGGALSLYWLTNRPKATRHAPQSVATLVEAKRLESASHRITIHAMGTVQAARTVVLSPRVGGEIIDVSLEFLPGGQFKAGDPIVKIEPLDYNLAVRQKQTEVEKSAAELARLKSQIDQCDCDIIMAQSELQMELGQQAVAKQEYELLGETVTEEDKEFVLRQPQLRTAHATLKLAEAAKKAAQAAYEAAQAAKTDAELVLEQAKLDLERTTIRAPFNAMIDSRSANLGTQVFTGTQLATLVGTDEYWVQVSVPVDQLKWITIPGANGKEASRARVYYEAYWGEGVYRTGTVGRLMADLEPEGRMARLLVMVKDPLSLVSGNAEVPPVILGAYLRVEIEGKELTDVVSISRSALRDGNKAWVMSPENTLDIRELEIIWSDDENVFISGRLRDGELLIVSDLAAPVERMPLRKAGANALTPSPGSARTESRTADEEKPL